LPTRGGIEARIGLENEAGGVNGRRLSYTWRDDASGPSENEQAARELVESEQVFGVMEMTTAATGGADYLGDRGVPVTGLAAEAAWANHTNMFSAQTLVTGDIGIDTWGKYVQGQGGTKALLLENKNSSGTTALSGAIGASMTAVGINVADTFDYTPGFSNPQQVVDRFLALDADSLVGALPPGDFAAIVAALRAAEAPLKVSLSATGYDQRIISQFGPQIAGETVFISYWPFEKNLPAHQMLLDGMARYAPAIQSRSDSMALRAYIAADLMIRGLKEAGQCPTRESFITALRNVSSYDGAGLLPRPLDMSDSFGKPTTCYVFMRVDPSGSKFDTVEPAPLCGDPVAPPA
jgi:ABC-type branched-subunit amino acid transport system substrate-binding protein